MTGVIEPTNNENPELYDAVNDEKGIEENATGEVSLFSLEMLHVIKEAQAQHGLRHSDYQRYHGYCNRRLKRIRKVLKFKMGEKRRVTPKKITESVFTDPRYMLMLLMTSERAWSMAMYLKQEASNEPRKRHHMVEKMRKAVAHAKELNLLCEESQKVDGRTKLESQAYSSYMSGILDFELKNWEAARDRFRQTQTIYSKLSDTMSKEEQPVYKGMVDEIIPNLRYCGYMIGDQSADDLMQMHGTGRQDPLLAGKLDSLISESRERKAASMSEATWRNRTVRIKNNKVRLFLIGVKDFEKDLSNIEESDRESRIEMYEQLLTECKDALQLTRDDIRSDPHSKTNERSDKVSDLQFLNTYLSYLRIKNTVKRNLLLVDDLHAKSPPMLSIGADDLSSGDTGRKGSRPSDFIRLYDVVLQNLTEIFSLPALTDDADLHAEVDVQRRSFQAFRCFYVAQAFVVEKKWAEAMALYDRVLEHSNYAISSFRAQGGENTRSEFDFVPIANLERLIETIAFNRYRVHASAVLDGLKEDPKEAPDTSKAICDRLERYAEDPAMSSLNNKKPNLKAPILTASFPPGFEAVPCKPLFFDLALNQATFPSLESKLGQKAGGQKAGITGMLSNWWGWGGKK